MHKKLQKYIESYDLIQNTNTYELKPNGGMIVLINQNDKCEVLIQEELFILDSFQAMLINAYEESVSIQSAEEITLVAVRFKGAGASFFYEEFMDELMHHPTEPIYLQKDILKGFDNFEVELDVYFQNRFKPSKSQFGVMRIIELVEKNDGDYDMEEVLRIANVPRKIFDKVFRWHVGLALKSYASIRKELLQ
ncbi:MAG: hypothetical protein C0626_12000 [Arcobacter sp.]|uniref:hypothetical protein n=1 Tax=uncultured Arcobacter sp. TaxID=165434 RepID=UPI000CAD456F|nr:hypothetical protein [uncultured Arcobacter sp.]PLY08574.1 MAG: hypothetical protein C0626_12000 [Arcobacter sp.]